MLLFDTCKVILLSICNHHLTESNNRAMHVTNKKGYGNIRVTLIVWEINYTFRQKQYFYGCHAATIGLACFDESQRSLHKFFCNILFMLHAVSLYDSSRASYWRICELYTSSINLYNKTRSDSQFHQLGKVVNICMRRLILDQKLRAHFGGISAKAN